MDVTKHFNFSDPSNINLGDLLDKQSLASALENLQALQDGNSGLSGTVDLASADIASPITQADLQESGSTVDVPFLNLDPYNTEGQGDLPKGELIEGPEGFIGSQLDMSGGGGETQVEFSLEVENYS